MDSTLQVVILAVIQGLTEFLPVSSSGHLVLLESVFGAAEGDLFLNVVLHMGTLGSVAVVYRREMLRLLRLDRPALEYLVCLAVGTLPAAAVGLTLKDLIERAFSSPLLVGFALLATALLLLSTRYRPSRNDAGAEPWTPRAPGAARALLIGCAQAVAITPGISRSGATITASLWLGLPRAEAVRFSFLLSVPAIGGALLLLLLDGDLTTRTSAVGLVLSALAAFAVGLFALRLTALAVIRRHFWKFGFYCLALGLVVLLLMGEGRGV